KNSAHVHFRLAVFGQAVLQVQAAGKKHGVHFRTHHDDDRNHEHPHQQGNGNTQRAVENAVFGVVPQVPAERHGGGKPGGSSHAGSGKHGVPWLGARHGVVVDERQHGDAGQQSDGPANQGPHHKDI